MERLFYQALDAKDPEAFFRGLAPRDQDLLIDASKVVVVKDEPLGPPAALGPVSALTTSCWTQEKRRVGENFLGYDVWRLYLRINWCEDGSTIQAPTSYSNHVDVNYPYWSYDGLIGQSVQGGSGYPTYDVFTQGQFRFCPPSTCLQYNYPGLT